MDTITPPHPPVPGSALADAALADGALADGASSHAARSGASNPDTPALRTPVGGSRRWSSIVERIGPDGPVAIELVVPVYNEERQLAASVAALHRFLSSRFPGTSRITIADNASTDGTWEVAGELVDAWEGVAALRLVDKGRGRALQAAWRTSEASVVAYVDVDLSTDLEGLPALLGPLLAGSGDVAVGSRLAPGARVVRGAKRELISRCYNALLRTAFSGMPTDAQCGFKAVRREVLPDLLDRVEDPGWFFDTELLVWARALGLRVIEVPVTWVDDLDSRVDVLPTALADLEGMARLLRGGLGRWGRRDGDLRASGPVQVIPTETVGADSVGAGSFGADPVGGRQNGGGTPQNRWAAELMDRAGLRGREVVLFTGVLGSGLWLVGAGWAALAAAVLVDVVGSGALRSGWGWSVRSRALPHQREDEPRWLVPALAGLTVAPVGVVGLVGRGAPAGRWGVGIVLIVGGGAYLAGAVARFVVLREWAFPARFRGTPVASETSRGRDTSSLLSSPLIHSVPVGQSVSPGHSVTLAGADSAGLTGPGRLIASEISFTDPSTREDLP